MKYQKSEKIISIKNIINIFIFILIVTYIFIIKAK